ncbi:MAG: ATP-dependent DNA helicase RecG [Gammaproteobacteria bacterium]|jgi:ATP-dependent DNA helicase RecG|nr:ATP-dependent DNA helicase RecG [Gammaproteobacteria bacterium]
MAQNTSLTSLKGVGPALAKTLEKLNLHRVDDLLFLLPLRYEDRTQLVKIGALEAGARCLVSGEVLLAETVFRGRRNLLVRVTDGSGQLTLRFFHFSRQQQAQFHVGTNLTCFGEVRRGASGFEMIHPEYRIMRDGQDAETSDSLTAIYPATEGVQQRRLRSLTDQALQQMLAAPPEELLPSAITRKLGMPSLAEAINYLHRPPPDADTQRLLAGTHPCQQRLAFEELLAHYLSLRNLRVLAAAEDAIALTDGNEDVSGFVKELPFHLTGAQDRVVNDILADLAEPHPMMRLIQGDVGSGKTVVAAIACVKAVACGVQAAIMAPTEILAEQHWRSFSDWFRPLGIEVAWLSGSQRAAARRESLEAIANGGAKLVVGTHALFQEGVNFHKLGLVVIDEQHRFGVHQRMALRDKGVSADGHPHQLVMTATPIPRTLAMAAYADLDTSVIDELPPGRQPVSTVAVPEARRDEVVARVRSACESGQQAYWVCPLIEESEVLDYQAAEASYQMLSASLPDLRIGLVHGRMRPAEKERGMKAFKDGLIQLLVATTVIEVGVDVPNASLMIIENAERMGLSQLHQLRGRVGRGAAQSHCVLLYKSPLGRIAKERLAVLRDTNDGFVVAQRDLELRGPGELLGTRQTGLPDYRIANLVRDAELMPQVQITAESIRKESESRAAAIVRRWLGDASRYGKV